jgi:hypothetical protein
MYTNTSNLDKFDMFSFTEIKLAFAIFFVFIVRYYITQGIKDLREVLVQNFEDFFKQMMLILPLQIG